jgi:hypothetical protein
MGKEDAHSLVAERHPNFVAEEGSTFGPFELVAQRITIRAKLVAIGRQEEPGMPLDAKVPANLGLMKEQSWQFKRV